jgi:hypothetical protein
MLMMGCSCPFFELDLFFVSHVRESTARSKEKAKVSGMQEKKSKSRASRNKFMKILDRAAIWGLFFFEDAKKKYGDTH